MRISIHKLTPLILAMPLLTGCNKSVSEYVSDFASGASVVLSDIASEASNTVSDYLDEAQKSTPHYYAVETFNEVFELVQAKDCQAIYDMFNEYVKENDTDLMAKIEQLVEFMDGDVVEMRHVGASNDYSTVNDGVAVSAGYSADTFVITDSGITYWFRVGVVTAADDETKLGLDWIYILDSSAKTAFINELVDWKENDGSESTEPQRPENMEIWVIYRP